MTHPQISHVSIIAALLLSTSAARAEVTAEQVWQSWQEFGSSSGQTITAASQSKSGDTLTLGGITYTAPVEGGSIQGTLDSLVMRERGDGTVEVTMSPEMPLTMKIDPPDAEAVEMTVVIRQPGLTLVAAGSADETSYDLAGPELGVALSDIKTEGQDVDLTMDMSVKDVTGRYLVKGSAMKDIASTFAAGSLVFDLAATSPENNGTLKMTGTMQDLAGTSTATFGSMMNMANLAEALKAGFATEGSFTYGRGDYTMDLAEGPNTTQMKAAADSGYFNVALDQARMAYGAGGTNADIVISGSQIPFPEINVKYGEAAFDFLMPVSKTDTPSDFGFMVKLADLSVSDFLWAMLDPAGQLPRDPATLILDLKGKATLNLDMMDQAQVQAAGDAPPGDLHALDVDSIRLSIAGAELTGNGGFTFDNGDKVTFNGMPAPTGQIDLKLVGGNGLLDKLVGMGLVPQEQAMGARMMMGLFARPGEGQDTLVSTIEVKDGGVYANGQRIQ